MGSVIVAGRQFLTELSILGRVNSFVLVTNFNSLMTRNIPAGSLPLGDWLRHYELFNRVGIFAYLGVRKLVSDDQELLARLQRDPVSFRTFVLGSASVVMVQSLAPIAWDKTHQKELVKLGWFLLKPSCLVLYMLQTEKVNSSVSLIWGLQDFTFQTVSLIQFDCNFYLSFSLGCTVHTCNMQSLKCCCEIAVLSYDLTNHLPHDSKKQKQNKIKQKTKLEHWHDVLIIWTQELKLIYFPFSVLNNTEMLSPWWTILRVSIIIRQEYRTCFFCFSTIDLWACSNSCLSSQWCHPNISFCVVLFSSCLQSFLASGSFPMS